MQLILFRPRHRQDWIDRLREKGWVVRVVHEAHKVRGKLVIIDAADGSWEKFVPVFVRKKMTVLLLSDDGLPQEKWTSLGISKVITTADELVWNEYSSTQEPPPLFEEDNLWTDAVPLSQRKERRELQEEESHREEEHSEASIHFSLQGSIEKNRERVLEHPVLPVSSASLPSFPAVLSVYAAKGGVGKTVFLLHLAAVLSSYVRSVCILDMDLMHGTVASTLQLQPKRTMSDLIRRMEDRKASLACLHQTEMGFSIMAAPREIGIALTQEQVLSMMGFLKTEMDVVLIDTPVYFDPMTKLAMEQSEQLLLMTTDEAASIHSLERMKPWIASLSPSPEIYIVLNRSSGDISKETLRDRLPWPLALELPEDEAVVKMIRRGECLSSGPYYAQIKAFVDRWMGVEKPSMHKRKWLARFLPGRP